MTTLSYGDAGVLAPGRALDAVARRLGPTLPNANVVCGFGGYAAVLAFSADLAIALTTDGVGSKTMIASALDRYDTVGYDLVAMNVNDLLCVGARPVAMLDYLGVNTLDPGRTDALLAGLGRAAEEARVAVPGGELAQLPDLIGPGDPAAFDFVGSAVGTVHPDEIVRGDAVAPGDALVGIGSSGIHSNGLTLARGALLERGNLNLGDHVEELGRSLGEELLEPTSIYVRPVLALWDAGVATHGLAHITGDGFRNLFRLHRAVGFVFDALPEPHAIFDLVARLGRVAAEEMYEVFNMGCGLVAVVADSDVDAAVEIVRAHGLWAGRVGRVTGEAGVARLEQDGVVLRAEWAK